MIASNEQGEKNHLELICSLDPKQRKLLELFTEYDIVTSKQVGELLSFQSRTNSSLCKKWFEAGFFRSCRSKSQIKKIQLS